jgi:cobalamin synthase
VAAGIVLAGDLALTGMLHMDGLLDTADGLFLHGAAERRLEVMRDSAVGAFGVSAAVAVLVLRWAALDALAPEVLVLAGIWSISRALMGFSAGYVPYARASGIASAFLGQGIDMAGQGDTGMQAGEASLPNAEPVASARACARACGLAGLALGIPFTLAGAAWPFEGTGAALLAHLSGALAALLLGVAAGAGVVLLARRRLGGFTGDVLGAAGVVTETVALVVLGARW